MKNEALFFFIIGIVHPHVTLKAAQKVISIDFLEKIQTDKTPLENYLKKSFQEEFLRTADFSQGRKTYGLHGSLAHFQGTIREATLFHCCYVVGGCRYTKAACAYLAHHAQNSPLPSLKHCNEEEFLESLCLEKEKKEKHRNCLLIGFQALKEGISDYEQKNTPTKPKRSYPVTVPEEPLEEKGPFEFLRGVGNAMLEELKALTGSD